MTPEEFVIWFRGFVTAANPYNITPKQWDDIQDQLLTVDDYESMWDIEPNEALIEAAEKYKKLFVGSIVIPNGILIKELLAKMLSPLNPWIPSIQRACTSSFPIVRCSLATISRPRLRWS